jgi:hypothetical protein
MYFLTEDGKLQEGTPLSNEKVQERERLIGHFHDQICKSRYHGSYDQRVCEDLANSFVTGELNKIAITPTPAAEEEKVEAE